MIIKTLIQKLKLYRSRDMREFLQENEFWPAVLRIYERLGLKTMLTSLEFLNIIRAKCVGYILKLNRNYDKVGIREEEEEEEEEEPWEDEEVEALKEDVKVEIVYDETKIANTKIRLAREIIYGYMRFVICNFNEIDFWATIFFIKALSCCENADEFLQTAMKEMYSSENSHFFDSYYNLFNKEYPKKNIINIIVSIEKEPAFEKKYFFDFSSLPEKPENIPYIKLFSDYRFEEKYGSKWLVDSKKEAMKELICAYKNKWERELFYQMYSDNYRRYYGDEGPSEGMKALLAELEQLSKSDEGLEEIVPLPPVQQEVAVAPAPPVEAAPQPAAPVDVSAYDTSVERCLRLALGDFFQSKVYKGMKFGKTHWRAVYEAYTEYAEPTFKDFARMLSTLFADKEKEWKLPDENNLSKALEKKQWKDGDKYNMVYKYMCAKMEEYYNMD